MPIRSVAMRASVADVEIVNCLGTVVICVRDYQVRRRGQLADRWALWRALPTVNLTHVDLTGDEQRPEEQYRRVSADGSTVCVLIRRLKSSCRRSIAFVVLALRHWLGGGPTKVKRRSPASSRPRDNRRRGDQVATCG
jgi:hypothetical protein